MSKLPEDVERVARAIASAQQGSPISDEDWQLHWPWHVQHSETSLLIKQARAAIAAIIIPGGTR